MPMAATYVLSQYGYYNPPQWLLNALYVALCAGAGLTLIGMILASAGMTAPGVAAAIIALGPYLGSFAVFSIA